MTDPDGDILEPPPAACSTMNSTIRSSAMSSRRHIGNYSGENKLQQSLYITSSPSGVLGQWWEQTEGGSKGGGEGGGGGGAASSLPWCMGATTLGAAAALLLLRHPQEVIHGHLGKLGGKGKVSIREAAGVVGPDLHLHLVPAL